MKYLYTIHYLEFSEYHNADFDCSVRVIDKNGELGERALKIGLKTKLALDLSASRGFNVLVLRTNPSHIQA